MILALTLISTAGIGWLVASRVWCEGELGRWERAGFALLSGILLWLASAWAMALTHTLRQPVVVGRTLLFTVVAAGLVPRIVRALRARADLQLGPAAMVVAAAVVPVGVWIGFVLWRGAIVPPLNHDALAYHLPKAAMFVRANGYRTFDALSYLITPRGSNYELLLADAIAGGGTDAFTEWPAVLFYVAFIACSVAIVERWFRSRAATLTTLALVLAGVPVLLLHSGGHKNDLLVGVFAAGGMLAAGRWLAQRDIRALLLAIAAFAALAGTKTHGVVLAASFAPLLAYPMLRPLRPKTVGLAAATAFVAVLLLGGFDQLAKLRGVDPGAPSAESVGVPQYGDWQNLWQAPYILVAAPFSRSAYALRVPWDSSPWFWRRYEIFFSHFGIPFSAAFVALPFAVFAFRKREGSPLERVAVTVAALVAFVLLLPVHFVPAGLYSVYLPRFVFFLLPITLGWMAPLVDLIDARSTGLGLAAVVAAGLVFCANAVDAALHDAFVPLRYVAWARAHPGTRVAPFDPRRVASVVDQLAGPRDRVAFDAGYAAWIYPAYGATLQRDVQFIPPGEDAPQIPDVDWVVIDRKFDAIWRNPQFTSLGSGQKFLARAVIKPEDSRVINALLRDPRYQPVLIDPGTKQAIFRRKH